jgi:hypothetical protein
VRIGRRFLLRFKRRMRGASVFDSGRDTANGSVQHHDHDYANSSSYRPISTLAGIHEHHYPSHDPQSHGLSSMLTILHFLASHITCLQSFLTTHPGPDFEPPDPPHFPNSGIARSPGHKGAFSGVSRLSPSRACCHGSVYPSTNFICKKNYELNNSACTSDRLTGLS